MAWINRTVNISCIRVFAKDWFARQDFLEATTAERLASRDDVYVHDCGGELSVHLPEDIEQELLRWSNEYASTNEQVIFWICNLE